MKLSVNWLKEFVDIDLSVDELTDKIGAQLGAVEEVTDLGKKYQGIVIAKVVECEKHPNADKLSLCKIDDGGKVKNVERDKDGLVQVVCGAPNVREGLLVAWLPPGAIVPSSFDTEPFVLEAREIRGKVSNGMLASASELALSDDHSGIVELSIGKIGDDFAKENGLDDYIIDVENKMFTHRPDCFGILGLAREIAGITGQQFKSPPWYSEVEKLTSTPGQLDLKIGKINNKLVQRFSANVIENVKIAPSPVWMQSYLSRVGIRPINNIVDVTNYTMYLTGQPLHAYDYDKLCTVAKTETAHLEARLSKKGDKLALLNGKTIIFDDIETILITSNDIPVGIGGVMGGADTEVDETTKNIVVECASFDMYAVRRGSMRHGLFTDAVTRFNKGQSYLQNPAVLSKAAAWMTDLSGGSIGKAIDEHPVLHRAIGVHLTDQFVNDRLGLTLGIKEMAKILINVEFDVAINGPTLVVTPPFWRTDIEIPEDVVEEIGRLYGYDHLPLELPQRSVTPAPKNDLLDLKKTVRNTLSAAGANELLTYSFVHGNLLDSVGQDKAQAFELSNALSPDLQYYRLSLTPSLLEKVHSNIKAGHEEFAIFEIGKAHNKNEPDPFEKDLPKEVNAVTLVYAAKNKQETAYYQVRMYLDNLLRLVTRDVRYEPLMNADLYNNPWLEQMTAPYDPARSAILRDNNGLVWGVVGELKPGVKRALKLPRYCAAFEVDPLLFSGARQPYQPLSRYPSVSQDISLKVPVSLSHGELFAFLQDKLETPDHTWHKLEPIDIYQSEDDTKHKNITFRLTIASYQKTLKAEEVNKLLDDVAAKAHDAFKAERQ